METVWTSVEPGWSAVETVWSSVEPGWSAVETVWSSVETSWTFVEIAWCVETEWRWVAPWRLVWYTYRPGVPWRPPQRTQPAYWCDRNKTPPAASPPPSPGWPHTSRSRHLSCASHRTHSLHDTFFAPQFGGRTPRPVAGLGCPIRTSLAPSAA